MISICPLTASDWHIHKQLCLQALQDSPDAFGSTYSAEHTQSDHEWEQRIHTALHSGQHRAWLAYYNETPCGLAWYKLATHTTNTAELFQMWVAPTARKHGLAARLLEAAIHWAHASGMQQLVLGVTQGNIAAIQLYQQSRHRLRHTYRSLG